MHFVWFRSTFLRVSNFLQIKQRGHNFWEEPILQKVWVIWSPILYFNFKRFLDPDSSLFVWFQCILHDSGVLFSGSWNFYKLKKGDLIYFAECPNYLVPPFCSSILKVFLSQILRHSLDFNAFLMNPGYFSQSIEISTN